MNSSRNPFQGGMGFFTSFFTTTLWLVTYKSQSLSGWDGVFHRAKRRADVTAGGKVAIPFRVGWGFSPQCFATIHGMAYCPSQSLSGWDGVFHRKTPLAQRREHGVAIPFRVGWGFSHFPRQ